MKTYNVAARINKDTKAMIQMVCRSQKISESLYLRRLIRKDLRRTKAHEEAVSPDIE